MARNPEGRKFLGPDDAHFARQFYSPFPQSRRRSRQASRLGSLPVTLAHFRRFGRVPSEKGHFVLVVRFINDPGEPLFTNIVRFMSLPAPIRLIRAAAAGTAPLPQRFGSR